MVAQLRVTNNSSERSDYRIDVNFADGGSGDLIVSQSITVDNLAPGQSTDAEAVSADAAEPTGFDCEVAEVDRFAWP
jgi:hypothetical protein